MEEQLRICLYFIKTTDFKTELIKFRKHPPPAEKKKEKENKERKNERKKERKKNKQTKKETNK